MDPQAAYEQWLSGTDEDERADAHEALRVWIRNGGFEPEWSSAQRKQFMSWRAS